MKKRNQRGLGVAAAHSLVEIALLRVLVVAVGRGGRRLLQELAELHVRDIQKINKAGNVVLQNAQRRGHLRFVHVRRDRSGGHEQVGTALDDALREQSLDASLGFRLRGRDGGTARAVLDFTQRIRHVLERSAEHDASLSN